MIHKGKKALERKEQWQQALILNQAKHWSDCTSSGGISPIETFAVENNWCIFLSLQCRGICRYPSLSHSRTSFSCLHSCWLLPPYSTGEAPQPASMRRLPWMRDEGRQWPENTAPGEKSHTPSGRKALLKILLMCIQEENCNSYIAVLQLLVFPEGFYGKKQEVNFPDRLHTSNTESQFFPRCKLQVANEMLIEGIKILLALL